MSACSLLHVRDMDSKATWLLFLALVGCGETGTPDAATDAASDTAIDTATDTAIDTASDAAIDTAIDTAVDSAIDADFDGSSPVCDDPDRECPLDVPLADSTCVGALSCTYPAGRGFPDWQMRCVDGRWRGDPPCSEVAGGGCAPPPLSEYCREPFVGTMSGVVRAGAIATTFREFETGERVAPVFGGQGSAMLALQLDVAGADAIDCAEVSVTLRWNGMPASARTNAELHCGSTRGVFVPFSFPDLECSEELHDLIIEVEVVGIASVSYTVEIMGGYLCFG